MLNTKKNMLDIKTRPLYTVRSLNKPYLDRRNNSTRPSLTLLQRCVLIFTENKSCDEDKIKSGVNRANLKCSQY